MTTADETITREADDRLAAAIASFEQARDAGPNPDPQDWLRRYSDVAPELAKFFADEQDLIAAAATVRNRDADG